ncbi:sigma factor-like helix-turn-helix DNA-binding protein [Geodermatophilus dictyosporus]|uniref:sigma factor-like helix-turn-helix DNA-binding protein n=1 Tax=Geodermatophilus dictyosporus TaxID=1523247 RepID=UPI00145C26ED|nr:sigma factor-like helix-turn-helix DNA-binding protein [Geodermatophilus dictyosporus]
MPREQAGLLRLAVLLAGDRGHAADLVQRALRSLPPRMRGAVVLRHHADLSEQQTAEVLCCSAGAVDTHTTRGVEALPD